MEKRLGKPAKKETTVERDEREAGIRKAAAEEERQRQANVDAGLTSSHEGAEKAKGSKTPFELEQIRLANKAGISTEKLAARIALRKKKGYG